MSLAMPSAVAPRRSFFERWSPLILLSVAQFMVTIDATVVNVALPSIGRTLHFTSAAELQWVVTAYVLVTGGLTLLGGRITDLVNRKQMFLAGLAVFIVASLTTGLSPSPAWLIASRALQGLGAALLTPAALAIITTSYADAERTTALGVWGALGAAGAAVGLVLGGMLTSWLGWQSVFFINVPIGLVAAAGGLFVVRSTRRGAGRLWELDVPGALLLIGGLAALVFAITAGTWHGWPSAPFLFSLLVAGGLLSGFVFVERAARRPIVPPATWRVRSLVSGNALYLMASAVMGGVFFLSSLYVQRVLGVPPWEAGLAFVPMAAAIGIGGRLGSALVSHAGTRPVLFFGFALEAVGAILLAGAPASASYFGNVLPGFLSVGFGLGLVFVAAPLIVMHDVRDAQAGMASGMMQTAHEVGISLGVAVFSAIATVGAAGGGFGIGFRQGLLAAAAVAGVVAVASVLVAPAVVAAGARPVRLHGGHVRKD